MKGDIYSRQKCPICGGRLIHNEKRNGCFCLDHPECGATRFIVRFGRKGVFKNFQDYRKAHQFLSGLRYKLVEGSFDLRDYQKEAPHGFKTLAKKYIKMKEQKGLRSINNIRNYMQAAWTFWDQKNIKTFTRADIREFLYQIKGISEKTRFNYMSCLRDFFHNLVLDEVINITQIPAMPEIDFDLAYRTVTDIETQTTILDKIYEMSHHINPKIWLGCDMLALYTNIRPKDLLNLTEGDIDAQYGVLTIKRPTKKKKNRKLTVRLIDEHTLKIQDIKKKYPGLPNMPFFRHVSGISGIRADEPFGDKYFYKWWIKACEKLEIKGLDLYGGTRHTTTTELAKRAGSQAAKKASGHKTNKAFERYCQFQDDDTYEIVRLAAKMKGKVIDFEKKAKK